MKANSCALAAPTFKEISPSILKFQPQFPKLEERFPKISKSLSEIGVHGSSEKKKKKMDFPKKRPPKKKKRTSRPRKHIAENISVCLGRLTTSLAYFCHTLQMLQ